MNPREGVSVKPLSGNGEGAPPYVAHSCDQGGAVVEVEGVVVHNAQAHVLKDICISNYFN